MIIICPRYFFFFLCVQILALQAIIEKSLYEGTPASDPLNAPFLSGGSAVATAALAYDSDIAVKGRSISVGGPGPALAMSLPGGGGGGGVGAPGAFFASKAVLVMRNEVLFQHYLREQYLQQVSIIFCRCAVGCEPCNSGERHRALPLLPLFLPYTPVLHPICGRCQSWSGSWRA